MTIMAEQYRFKADDITVYVDWLRRVAFVHNGVSIKVYATCCMYQYIHNGGWGCAKCSTPPNGKAPHHMDGVTSQYSLTHPDERYRMSEWVALWLLTDPSNVEVEIKGV